MSISKYDKETGTLTTLANGTRLWIGTKKAHDSAVEKGTMPNNCLVVVTDDHAGNDLTIFDETDFNVDETEELVSLLPARRIFSGTKQEWDSLSKSEKIKYGFAAFDNTDPEYITDLIQDGNLKPVTSSALYARLGNATMPTTSQMITEAIKEMFTPKTLSPTIISNGMYKSGGCWQIGKVVFYTAILDFTNLSTSTTYNIFTNLPKAYSFNSCGVANEYGHVGGTCTYSVFNSAGKGCVNARSTIADGFYYINGSYITSE